MEGQVLVAAGILLVFLGIVLVFVGSLISVRTGESGGGVEGGGVVLIGPIPIVFGTSGRAAAIAALLAVILMVLVILLYVIQRGGLK